MLNAEIEWLERKSCQMIRDSRQTMKDGVSAFPPQVGCHYDAFWLRDYAYMLEGCVGAFSDKELKDACRTFVNAQRADGAFVDCIRYDGTPIYKPGYGTMGENPVADGTQFTVDVVWCTYQKTRDMELVREVIDRVIKGMEVLPRDPQNGLVYIRPGDFWDRCPYGFVDTIRQQGDVLFCSLLDVQASRQLADLLTVVGRKAEAETWKTHAEKVSESIRRVLWDAEVGLFRAATVQCREHDIWGSAFAVFLGVADEGQSLTIAKYFQTHYSEIVRYGHIRHLPGGVWWGLTGCPHGQYQNGAFWGTPVGWFVYTLDLADTGLADKTVRDLVADFQAHGVYECINEGYTNVPEYIVSTTLPLAGIRAMVDRRSGKKNFTSTGV
jgi:hypothetical protein